MQGPEVVLEMEQVCRARREQQETGRNKKTKWCGRSLRRADFVCLSRSSGTDWNRFNRRHIPDTRIVFLPSCRRDGLAPIRCLA